MFLDRKGGSRTVTAKRKSEAGGGGSDPEDRAQVQRQKRPLGRNGPEVMKYEGAAFLMMFFVQPGTGRRPTLSWPQWPVSVDERSQ